MDALSLKDVQLSFIYYFELQTVEFIYFSLLHFSLCYQQDVKLISYFDKTNKIAIRIFSIVR